MFLCHSSELPKSSKLQPINTYKVGTGHAALLKKSVHYEYIVTCGLRTCVAFALISPDDGMCLLVHFYSLAQVRNHLNSMCDAFFKQLPSSERFVYCGIVGGRFAVPASEDMVNEIQKFAMKNLLTRLAELKLFITAPIVADDDETFSLRIHLSSGTYQIFMDEIVSSRESSTTAIASEDDEDDNVHHTDLGPIVFSNTLL